MAILLYVNFATKIISQGPDLIILLSYLEWLPLPQRPSPPWQTKPVVMGSKYISSCLPTTSPACPSFHHVYASNKHILSLSEHVLPVSAFRPLLIPFFIYSLKSFYALLKTQPNESLWRTLQILHAELCDPSSCSWVELFICFS
jgi:hypothetical protein